MERITAIVRVNSKALGRIPSDLIRLGHAGYSSVNFKVPEVMVLKRKGQKGVEFEKRPLLFNYGFLEIPIQYTYFPDVLNNIRGLSEVLQGFIFRNQNELKRERLQAELEGLGEMKPILIKTISPIEVERLFSVARSMDVYQNTDSLAIGTFIILKGYPFEGLAAEVKRKKTNGKVQVELLDSGLQVWLEYGNIYYSDYSIEEYDIDN